MAFEFPNLSPGLPYLGPTQVKAYIQDWWLDEVAGVSYQVVDERRPLYGFRNNSFSAVSMGQTLVSGQILCLFRFPGYLARLLNEILAPGAKTNRSARSSVPVDRNVASLAQDDMKALLQELFVKSKSRAKEVSQALKDLFHKKESPIPSTPPRPGEQQVQKGKRFDLRLVYGWSEDGVSQSFEQVIQDVYLTGQSQQFNSLNGDGDTCLLEAYDFIGRNVIVK